VLTEEFDYQLPAEMVAQYPRARGESRLLLLDADQGERHRHISDLPEQLEEGDVLVVNDTRVLPARLFARRLPEGGKVELLLAERLGEREWDALLRPGGRAWSGAPP
jgi:S-adenosylmethionine:tRNA ribosyltransferase-isomerase